MRTNATKSLKVNIESHDWARLAAFIDGEGCISICHQARLDDGRPQHVLVVNLANTDPRLVAWVSATFGVGRVQLREHSNRKWKPLHYWQVTGSNAVELLRGCYKFLLLKKEQADIAFAFSELIRVRGKKRRLSDDNYQAREVFHQQMRTEKSKIIPIREVLSA